MCNQKEGPNPNDSKGNKITVAEMQASETNFFKDLNNIKKAFENSTETINSILEELESNSHINAKEKPLYLDIDDQVKELVHDYTNFNAGEQNQFILNCFKNLKAYENIKEKYCEQLNSVS